MVLSRLERTLLTARLFLAPEGESGGGGAPAPNDAMTRSQMTDLLRTGSTQVDRVGTAYDSAASTYEYTTRKHHYLADEPHAASFEEYLPPVRDAEDLVLREAGAAQRHARPVLG